MTSHPHFNTQQVTSNPLAVVFPAAVTDLPHGKCKIKRDFLLRGWNIEKIIKKNNCLQNLHRIDIDVKTVVFIIHVIVKYVVTVTRFSFENVYICKTQCIYLVVKFQVSILSGVEVMIQNLHVQFLFCISIIIRKTTNHAIMIN